MKVINRQAFLAMPPGTLYSSYEPCVFGELRVKGDNCGDNDWFCIGVSCPTYSERVNALESGASIPIDLEMLERDGQFELPKTLYVVWEPADVRKLIAKLIAGLCGEA